MYVEQAADAVVFDELIKERVALREEGGLQLHHEPLGDPPTQGVHPIQRVVLLYHTHGYGSHDCLTLVSCGERELPLAVEGEWPRSNH